MEFPGNAQVLLHLDNIDWTDSIRHEGLKIDDFVLSFPVIQALVALVNDPEPDHPLRADLAEEFVKDKRKFIKNAEEFTRKHGEKRPAD